MLPITALALQWLYFALPAVAVGMVLAGRSPWRRMGAGAWGSGLLIGGGLVFVYTGTMGGRMPVPQVLLTLYCAVGLVMLLRLVDSALQAVVRRVVRPTRATWRGGVAFIVRAVLLAGFALPWVMAATMTYRPRVIDRTPSLALIGPAERVRFAAADGTEIAGLYIPAPTPTDTTALLCHGLGGTPGGFAALAERLHQSNVAVLAIDLRAHGESGGQTCTYGLREAADAAAAVAWLKARQPEAARHVVGVGASLGAAALLSAAADGAPLDGIAVLSTYTTLPDELDAAARLMPWPVGLLVRQFGLPMASLHAGADLATARPIDAIAHVWPRPVLVIHGMDDRIIPFDFGRKLYDAATLPKSSMWVRGGTHNGILDDAAVIERVVEFTRSATPLPVI